MAAITRLNFLLNNNDAALYRSATYTDDGSIANLTFNHTIRWVATLPAEADSLKITGSSSDQTSSGGGRSPDT